MKEILQNFLDESIAAFRSYKKLAERAVEQVSDEEFFRLIDAESNSPALIVKHLAGNLRSRWTDFLTADGEKPQRNRDAEFAETGNTRANLMQNWEASWQILFVSLESLTIEDLGKIIQIRGEDFTVVRAIIRSLAHTAYHVGQIAFLAKHFRASEWKTLSIPKNKSAEFNAWLNEQKNKGSYLETAGEFNEQK
ncbi:MAG: DUF1572 family protein [Pyrinomonadaceae bacterium]